MDILNKIEYLARIILVIKGGMFNFQAQMEDKKEQMEEMKGYVNHILFHNPEVDFKLNKFETISTRIHYVIDNKFNSLNEKVRVFELQLHETIQEVCKHDLYFHNYEEILVGKGSNDIEDSIGHLGDGFCLEQPMHFD